MGWGGGGGGGHGLVMLVDVNVEWDDPVICLSLHLV